jgi:hypothetical protein
MESMDWYLLSLIVWPIIIVTMMRIKASRTDVLIGAIFLNIVGFMSLELATAINIFCFVAFLYGGISGKLKRQEKN